MSNKKILVVEDDRDQMIGLAVRLRANGYEVLCATDGTTAFTMANKMLPSLILLDIGLPAGDGFKVIEWLAGMATTASIPVIVLSGRDPNLARDQVLRMGAKAFFQKPADNDALLAAIREVLTTGTTQMKDVAPSEAIPPPAGTIRKPGWAISMAERIERWREDLSKTPNDTALMNDIARVLLTTDDPALRNVEEALQLVKKAYFLMKPANPLILDTLSLAFAASGQIPQALDAARRGLALANQLAQNQLALDLKERISLYEQRLVGSAANR